ncbi:hypothetical protein [Sphingobacterium spiritivorum]|uniref:hypothetical protein n=1 Tax=Sphingobacterium spiritivorum TaxID=258 RepID=UPI003DA4AAA1
MKKFTRNGNEYKLNTQWGLYIPLVGSFVILTIAGFTAIPESSFKWWMIGIVVLLILSILNSYLIIDVDKKEIRTKTGFIKVSRTIPFADLKGFTVHKTLHFGFITTNVGLVATYRDNNGKKKDIQLAQSFFARPIQHILNEIDEIISYEHQRYTQI